MSECFAYDFPERQCRTYPHGCDNCQWSTARQLKIGQSDALMWRRAKAGRSFGKDTIVLYDGDPDPRLVRSAVNDCIYIYVDDLKKLPIDEQK